MPTTNTSLPADESSMTTKQRLWLGHINSCEAIGQPLAISFKNECTTSAAACPYFYANILEKFLPIKVHCIADVEKIVLNLYWRDIETQDLGHQWLRELIKDMCIDRY